MIAQYAKVRRFILDLLKKELSEDLFYHDVLHTMDVIRCADMIARAENVSKYDLLNIKTAALIHDTGFLNTYDKHEEASCDLARQYLPHYAYSEEQIDTICRLIMATKLSNTPQTLPEKILRDADLDYLGRTDFFTIGQKLFKEWQLRGYIKNDTEWIRLQITFLENHCYYTPFSIANRAQMKAFHLATLKENLALI